MRLPNFFIVGAAKAGTSSLYEYLSQHPEVYFPDIKEPSFFAFAGEEVSFSGPGDELFSKNVTARWDEYKNLYTEVQGERAIGDASVVYLYSEDAPGLIAEKIPNAKVIIILRNPVDRAFSSYCHLRRDGRENIESFSDAIQLEDVRKAENWQHLWHYSGMSLYAQAIDRYLKAFDGNVLILKYEDFYESPTLMMKKICTFLGVDQDFDFDFSRKHNISRLPRSALLHKLFKSDYWIKRLTKKFIPKSIRNFIRTLVMSRNLSVKKPELDSETRLYLLDYFRDDIRRTQEITGIDLSAWLR